MEEEIASKLHKMKRKRTIERSNATRFTNIINNFTDTASIEDHHYYRSRLQDTLDNLTALDNNIQDLLSDNDFEADIEVCETYIESVKRALQLANSGIDNKMANTMASLNIVSTTPTTTTSSPSIKLPAIKLEPFTGNIEEWSRFWEQFGSSIDQNPAVSVIDKHVYLRGYLHGEPKNLVEGIAVTANTYEETKTILKQKYGDKNRIIQAHLDFLDNLQPICSVTPEALNKTYVECNRRLQALRALGENTENYGRVLAPKILRAFPSDICQRWITHAKRQNIPESSITKLMEFLNEEVEGVLTTQKIQGSSIHINSALPTTAAFQVNTKPKTHKRKSREKLQPFCVFCDTNGHWAQECTIVIKTQDRIEKLKQSSRCFLCLNRGHYAKNCNKRGKSACTVCKRSHHYSICTYEPATATSVNRVCTQSQNFTYLQTAKVQVVGPTGLCKQTRCIFDGGSQSSFISASLVEELHLTIVSEQNVHITAFESDMVTQKRRIVSLKLQGVQNNASVYVTAFESHNTYSTHPRVPQDVANSIHLQKLPLADAENDTPDLPIELLIGGDHYWKLVKDTQPIRISNSLVLIPSIFGWVLSGNRSGINVNQMSVHNITLESHFQNLDHQVRNFWDLEALGITDVEQRSRTMSVKDSEILEQFHKSHHIEDGRRVVSLPKNELQLISDNRNNAEKRFRALQRHLQQDKEYAQMYKDKMLQYILQKQVEIVDPDCQTSSTYYLPHHAVHKTKGNLTKWRIVFDASSHEKGSPSLNDTLETGPNLLPDILSVLFRFRLYQYAVLSDINQAFLQLTLNSDDRDLTRFFWFRIAPSGNDEYHVTEEVTVYRFTRLPFGLTCSPFLLSATIQELATKYRIYFPAAAPLIASNMYMDDFTASTSDEKALTDIYNQLTDLMNVIRLPMSKWATNSATLQQIWKSEHLPVNMDAQFLGIYWNTKFDTISISPTIQDISTVQPTTKRFVLQVISRLYDPLGFFSPVTIVGKLLFQETWIRGIEWQETLPKDIGTRWSIWYSKLHYITQLSIPRWIGDSVPDLHSSSLHVFCDASEKAYGSVIYFRFQSDNITTIRLVCSKVKLAPIKRVTLPRLELLAALIGTRLLHHYCQATNSDISQATIWTDSTVTLGWIRSDPNRWKTFICNRVTEITNRTSPSQWRHCPGSDNPADLLSRGLQTPDLCADSNWWHGPTWLKEAPRLWPSNIVSVEYLPEEKKSQNIFTISASYPLINFGRFSSYIKLLRTVAWILRFVTNIRLKSKQTGELKVSELENSRLHLIRIAQKESFAVEYNSLLTGTRVPKPSKIASLHPFLQDNVIRLGGRLHFSNIKFDEKHPIILDGHHHLTRLLISHAHLRLYHLGFRNVLSELRTQYWILRARQTIRKVLNACLPCKMTHNQKGQEIEAPLPADRIRYSTPFSVTGLDFAGPLYARHNHVVQKTYVLLLTCAITRAVHLELSSDMSVETFLMAFERFTSRRGIPHTVYSDNATTFHAANNELRELTLHLEATKTAQHFSNAGIHWKFIASRAAWWGGWWERMVGTTKRCIRKVLGHRQVDIETLSTILTNIEAAINSRPLTQDEGIDALTPAHFLIGNRLTVIPTGPEPLTNMNLKREHRLHEQATEHFWKRWSKEYLLQLKSFHQVRQTNGRSTAFRVGDLVLLQEDVRPRHMWRKALIQELRPGRDGKIRTVLLRTSEGRQISRPVQLVIPLEVDQGGEDVRNCA